MAKWFENSYVRQFQDFHIPDWNKKFLTKYNHAEIADWIKDTGATAATVFSNAHTGFSHYPSKVGKTNELMRDRDWLREMIDNLHSRGLAVVIYYCTLYTQWYYDNHPEARIVDGLGRQRKVRIRTDGHPERFPVLCLNNEEYRRFVVEQLTEICTNYEFEGMWPDMTWWPAVCCCPSCTERFLRETGSELPRVINWEDETWALFAKKRRQWLAEYANMITDTIKKLKPNVTVAHQSGTYGGDWRMCPSVELASYTDWLSADLYRTSTEMIFYSKLFHGLSNMLPYEHLNGSCSPNIYEHTVTKEMDEFRVIAFTALAHNGAFNMIDAIDPVGTINPLHYQRLKQLAAEMEPYIPYAGGTLCHDVAIYYSFESGFDMQENGKPIEYAGYCCEDTCPPLSSSAHPNGSISLATALLRCKIAYTVITRKDLGRLGSFKAVLIANAVMMDDEEGKAFEGYVHNGGALYFSKDTGLLTMEGHRRQNLLFGELAGVQLTSETAETVTYVAPVKARLFEQYTVDHPCTLHGRQNLVETTEGVEVLATVALPYTDTSDVQYSSLLSDPPGIYTDSPALTLNRYGAGKVIYASGAIETWNHASLQRILGSIVMELAGSVCLRSEAPYPVEITMFDRPDLQSILLHMVNIQQNKPLPSPSFSIDMDAKGHKVCSVKRIPDGAEVEFLQKNGRISLTAPGFDYYQLLEVRYKL